MTDFDVAFQVCPVEEEETGRAAATSGATSKDAREVSTVTSFLSLP